MIQHLDTDTRLLVRLSAAISGADESTTRRVIDELAGRVGAEMVDEVILQSYLFAGFPRALNAARMWRAASGLPAPPSDDLALSRHVDDWERDGEATCAIVYGASYDMLRRNIRELHPAAERFWRSRGYL